MTRRTMVFAFAAMSALVISCGSSQSAESSRPEAPNPRRRLSEVISAEELSESGESNVYLAVQRLRPQWLRSAPRGATRLSGAEPPVVVYIDATRFGTLSSLQSLQIGGIYEIRRYDASEATNRFGTGHTNGAIVVRMTKP